MLSASYGLRQGLHFKFLGLRRLLVAAHWATAGGKVDSWENPLRYCPHLGGHDWQMLAERLHFLGDTLRSQFALLAAHCGQANIVGDPPVLQTLCLAAHCGEVDMCGGPLGCNLHFRQFPWLVAVDILGGPLGRS